MANPISAVANALNPTGDMTDRLAGLAAGVSPEDWAAHRDYLVDLRMQNLPGFGPSVPVYGEEGYHYLGGKDIAERALAADRPGLPLVPLAHGYQLFSELTDRSYNPSSYQTDEGTGVIGAVQQAMKDAEWNAAGVRAAQEVPMFQQGTESLLPTDYDATSVSNAEMALTLPEQPALGVNERDYRSQIYDALSGMRTGREELAELEEMGSITPGIRRNLVNWVTGKVEDIGDLPFAPQLIDRDQFLPQTPGMFEPTEEDWTWNDPRLARTLVAHKAFQAGDRLLNAALGKIGIDRTKVHRAENKKIAEDLGEAKFGRPLSNSEMDALLHISGGIVPVASSLMPIYETFDQDDPLSALQDAINNMVVSSGFNKGKTIEELFDDPSMVTGGEDNLQWSDLTRSVEVGTGGNVGRSMSLDVPMEFEGRQLEPQYPYMGTDVSNVRLDKPVERMVPEREKVVEEVSEKRVKEIKKKPKEKRTSVEEQVVVASEVQKALSNAAKGKPVKQELKAIVELAKVDPTIVARYTTPGSQALQDITAQVDSFSFMPTIQKKKKQPVVDPWAFEDRRGGRR